jgi:hypothetical protein
MKKSMRKHAQAAALRQARTEKAYRRFGLTWNQFCPKHLKMSGTQADEIIRQLEEFGPEYFENTESVRESQRALLLPAPAPAPAPEEPAAAPILSKRLTAVSRRAMDVVALYREVARDARETEPSLFFRSMLRGSLARISDELARVGYENGLG